MLYIRYFVLVGAALLVALFAVDAYLPKPEQARDRAAVDKSTIRISSTRKPVEQVIIDTSLPTIIPPARETVNAALSSSAPAASSFRQAFAEIAPLQKSKSAATVRKAPVRRAVAKKTLHREVFASERTLPNFFGDWLR